MHHGWTMLCKANWPLMVSDWEVLLTCRFRSKHLTCHQFFLHCQMTSVSIRPLHHPDLTFLWKPAAALLAQTSPVTLSCTFTPYFTQYCASVWFSLIHSLLFWRKSKFTLTLSAVWVMAHYVIIVCKFMNSDQYCGSSHSCHHCISLSALLLDDKVNANNDAGSISRDYIQDSGFFSRLLCNDPFFSRPFLTTFRSKLFAVSCCKSIFTERLCCCTVCFARECPENILIS